MYSCRCVLAKVIFPSCRHHACCVWVVGLLLQRAQWTTIVQSKFADDATTLTKAAMSTASLLLPLCAKVPHCNGCLKRHSTPRPPLTRKFGKDRTDYCYRSRAHLRRMFASVPEYNRINKLNLSHLLETHWGGNLKNFIRAFRDVLTLVCMIPLFVLDPFSLHFPFQFSQPRTPPRKILLHFY